MINAELIREIDLRHAQICGALADPTRIALMYAIREGPVSVGELADGLSLSQATVSRHLKVLRDRGLVAARRDGMHVYYSLADGRAVEALDLLRGVLNDNLARGAELARALS